MKKLHLSRLAPALLALALVVAPLTLRAEEAKEKPLSKAKAPYDADKDGKLNEAEQAAAKEGAKAKSKATREANLEKYDANKDGKLDKAERAKQQADEQAERDAMKAERAAKKTTKTVETK